MQVDTIYTFKNHLYIVHPVSSHKIKSRRFVSYLGGVFNKTIILLALVGYGMIIANSALRASLAIYHLITNACTWNKYILLDGLSYNTRGYFASCVVFFRAPQGRGKMRAMSKMSASIIC